MGLILASSSVYRKALLERLRLDFKCISPEIDESPHPNEGHIDLVRRLATEKAQSVLSQNSSDVCIGCDTIASCDDKIFGKPMNLEASMIQLKSMVGKKVMFYTGVCVASDAKILTHMVPTTVIFRQNISDAKLKLYCELEKPFHSSGSFRSETSVVNLIECMISDDPTAIVGIPLIKLSQMLEKVGL